MGWESSTGVMRGVHGVPWGGLAPHGAGTSAGPLLPPCRERGLGKPPPGTSSSDQLRPPNVHARRIWLAVGWAGVRAWSSLFFLKSCFVAGAS